MERLTKNGFTITSDFVKKSLDLRSIVKCLQKLQRYEDVGSIEELEDAKEKRTAKNPRYEGNGYYKGELVLDTWYCPCCETEYEVDYDNYKYCPNCGQAIDLSNLEQL